MIETLCFKNAVIFIQTILSFVPSRKIRNICNNITCKYGNVPVKYFRKLGKLEYKKNKKELDLDVLNSCKQLDLDP